MNDKPIRSKPLIWLWWLITVLMMLLDQIVKRWASLYLQPVGQKPFIPGLLRFTYAENQGASFGILQGGRWFFVVMTLLVLGVIIYYFARLPKERIYLAVRIPMVFIAAGALGNLIDRIRYGYVVDMFEFAFIRFPIFNVADMCLVCGTIVMMFVVTVVLKDITWK